MPATFLSEQKTVFKKLHGKLMKNATNAALHRRAGRGQKKKVAFLLPNSVVCQLESS